MTNVLLKIRKQVVYSDFFFKFLIHNFPELLSLQASPSLFPPFTAP